MQKKELKKSTRHLTVLVLCAILSALSILFGKYLAINLGDTIRISFENLPILMAGLYFGPSAGAAVGVVADLVGCFLVGYSINPIITLAAAVMGLWAGFVGICLKKDSFKRVFLTVFPAHIIGSLTIKTVGLWIYYQMPFWATLGLRAVTYLLVSVLEIALLYLLSKNRAFSEQIRSLGRTSK